MKFKKIISGMLAVVMVFTAVQTGVVVQAAETKQEINSQIETAEFFVFDEDKGAITEYLGKEQNVIIPSQIEGVQVEVIGSNAFASNDAVVTVVIPKGVTMIEQEAFLNCSNLKSVVIPKGMEDIEKLAFFMCKNLEQVTIGSGVACIETNTFYGCGKLKNITLPNSVSEIEDYAFMDCASLTEIAIPNGTAYLGTGLFRGCKSLETVSIPNSVKMIDEDTFEDTDAVIICEEGSAAHKYALNHGIQVEIVDHVNNITENEPEDEDEDEEEDEEDDGADEEDEDEFVYDITYKLNGGKLKGVIISEYDGTYSIRLPKAVRKGYTFLGWYENGKKVTVIKRGSTGDKTYVAKWKKVTKPSKVSISSVKNSGSKKMTVKLKNVSGAKGYQIVYATNKSFSKNVKKITLSSNGKTVKGLKRGKTYYVKARAYKVDSANNKIYGSYSFVKKVTINK
ncbi:MAG: leucine-rich repeat protein [Lachnospiraceae bacterium]|nr:leucine-rich repeat protein [Lachnospiraceae bacterium]